MRTFWFLSVCSFGIAQAVHGQAVPTFGGNAQHTAIYQPAAQDLNQIRWSTVIDLAPNPNVFVHYGAPVITSANTVIAPVKNGSAFSVSAFTGSNGASLYSQSSDYMLPSYDWVPVFQPVVATSSPGTRLYYPTAGGTVSYIDNLDTGGVKTPVRLAFYGLSNYQANTSGFNSTVFVNTPITADASGNIFFGFRVQGTAPAPLNTAQSGFARIDPNGNGTYVLAGNAAGDANITRDSHNSAPAISTDGSTVYVPVKATSTEYYGYLLGLNSTTLATKYEIFLKDPRNGNNAGILDDSTASPTVAPDGDVYFGIMSNPDNGSRGFLLRFSADLTSAKTPGGFGWDYTAAIVPASMAPLYTGPSRYLIFSKYNNYANTGDGNGVNRIALLDPNDKQIDPHPSANGLIEMREVLTAIGPTPDSENPSITNAVREWCINTAAVNPATNSIFTPSEDGHTYRWNLATNSLSQVIMIGSGVGEPYVPTVIGPDGTVYTLNGGSLFALGGLNGVSVQLSSSTPDLRSVVLGQSLTFTAAVANPGSSGFTPTGTVTFQDTTYTTSGPTTTTLQTINLDGTGHAAYTTSALSASPNPHQHFITAAYGGDGNFQPGSIVLVQDVHTYATATTLTSSPNPSSPGQSVTFTATVATVPPGPATPTGMVTFQDGATTLAQAALGSGATVSFSTTSLSAGSHSITAVYASDSVSAASTSNAVTQTVQSSGTTTTTVGSSPNPSVFGQSVTFTATVTCGSGTPTGTVTFVEGATTLASSVAIDASGHASFSTSALLVGSHTITANFTGTNGWTNSSGSDTASPQVMNKAATSTQVSSSAPTSAFGQQVTFTATVIATSPGSGLPSSSVTFRDGSMVLATVSLDANGRATFSTSTLAIGSHPITAAYGGDGNFSASTSTSLNQTVNKYATATALTSSADPAVAGQPITFTATVSVSAPGSGTPSGSVTFRDKNTVLQTVTLDATGHAAFMTSSLSQGAHQITAAYAGAAGYAASTSSTLVENISKK